MNRHALHLQGKLDRRNKELLATGRYKRYIAAYSKEQGYCYIRIAKTGTQSVLKSLNKLSKDLNLSYNFFLRCEHLRFVFAFVRNPWDRVVSAYQNIAHDRVFDTGPGPHDLKLIELMGENKTFENFVQKISFKRVLECGVHWRPQVDSMPEEMDFVGRFENLQKDFDIVCEKIGLTGSELPHINKSSHSHYTEYYNNETRELVAQKYAKDIERFEYKFGDEI